MASYGYTFSAGDTVTPARLNAARTVSDIQTADIANSQITTAKIADANVTSTKLAYDGGPMSGFRNRIINGNFDVWQRGTTFTGQGYIADRWNIDVTGSTFSNSRQAFTAGQTGVPNNPQYFCQTAVTSVSGSGNYAFLEQRIEDVRTLSGQSVTVSFYAKADSNKSIAVELNQAFGTGGSPSPVVTSIGSQKFNLTSSWQKFLATIAIPSISGKTIGSDNNSYFSLVFWLDAGSNFNARTDTLGKQSGTFDIAQVQVEQGSVATPFEARPIGTELALCQRYYFTGRGLFQGAGGGGSAHFPVEMRANPTVTTGAIDAGTGGTWGVLGKQAVFEQVANSAGSGATFTASAEL